MHEILPLLHADALTVTGRTVAENVADARASDRADHPPADRSVEHAKAGWRSCAATWPRARPSPSRRPSTPASTSSPAARGASTARRRPTRPSSTAQVQPGEVVVIRYEGPKGGPGMREMYTSMKLLYGRGLALRDRGGHRRAILGHQQRLLRGPRLARGGRRRPAGRRPRRRHDHDRHPAAPTAPARRRRRRSKAAWPSGSARRCDSPAATWPSTPAWPSRPIKGPSSGTGSRDRAPPSVNARSGPPRTA